MTRPLARLRRFHFNFPQRIAAGLLALFLIQGLWITRHQTLSDRDYQYARCGRETWEKPSPLAGYYTTCGNIHDGILAYRIAGLPLTVNLLVERRPRPLSQARGPRRPSLRAGKRRAERLGTPSPDDPCSPSAAPSVPCCGCVLGAGLWWVTRRLYGNLGGYVALALYCFSPPILKACVSPNPDIFATLGVYGGIYTCIGVAHAMQGPRGKWRPRIILLTVVFGIAAAAHIAALPAAALLGLVLMMWIAEGRRSQILPVVLLASAGALLMVFACYGFSPDAFSYVFRSAAGFHPSHSNLRAGSSLPFQCRHHRCRRCVGFALSRRAALALLWQHRSAFLLPCSRCRWSRQACKRAHGFGGLPFLLTFMGRRLCRRLREHASQGSPRSRRGDRAPAGGFLYPHPAGADLKRRRDPAVKISRFGP